MFLRAHIIHLVLLALLLPAAHADDFVAGYHLEGRFLLLGSAMRGQDGSIKPFEAMAPDEIATIYHELWHAWFLEARSEKRQRIHSRFEEKANRIHAAFPEEKRLEIQEEAAADFIDAVIGTAVQLRRFLLSKDPQTRKELLNKPRMRTLYQRVFSDTYTGYYTRSVRVGAAVAAQQEGTGAGAFNWDINANPALAHFAMDPAKTLGPFLNDAERFGLPVGYLREAVPLLKGVVFLGELGLPLPAPAHLRAPVDPSLAKTPPAVGLPSAPPPVLAANAPAPPSPATPTPQGLLGKAAMPQPTPSPAPDLISRAAANILKGALGVDAKSPASMLMQSDIVPADTPLDAEDMQLLTTQLFEGRLSPSRVDWLGAPPREKQPISHPAPAPK